MNIKFTEFEYSSHTRLKLQIEYLNKWLLTVDMNVICLNRMNIIYTNIKLLKTGRPIL